MSSEKRRIDVMVSSTTDDLGTHRQRLSPIITSLMMTPRMMDNDSAMSKDGLTYSLDLVDEAEIYILLLGFRYGYVPDDPRNPDKLSMTHLEYRRAKQRAKKGALCVLVFLLEDEQEPEVVRPELTAFRKEVLQDKIVFFADEDDLEKKVLISLNTDECVQRIRESGGDEREFEPHEGEILAGRYTFINKLGEGGNGEVWHAHESLPDETSTREVAIKILKREVSNNPKRIHRFKQEISVAMRLNHPHIIRTTHWGDVGSQFYAVMDYVPGETLREFMRNRQFNDTETVRYLQQIAEALDLAHQQRIVHRDVKPANILVQDDTLLLGDFGLAVSPEEQMSLTDSGEWVGTKKYMAPEQWDNQPVSPATDVYALGIIAYEMLTGEFPFDAVSHARLLTQHMNDPLPAHSALADEILAILRRATAKAPTERYPTPVEFIVELAHWEHDPANIDTKIAKYLSTLRVRLKGDVYEKLFVDLAGDIRHVLKATPQPPVTDTYADRFLDEFDEQISNLLVDLDADHHQPDTPQTQYVEDILAKLTESERVVLVGEPGSGKTFTLRRLVMRYINQYAKLQRVPVFVPLNAFKGEESFLDYIRRQMGELAPYYNQLVKDKRLVLICDALNEMPRRATDETERALLPEVRQTLAGVPLFVVSCRVRDYHNDLDQLGLERLEVRDLELPAIREFVRRYRLLLNYDDEALWQRMGGSPDLMTFWQQVRKEGKGERFWQQNADLSWHGGKKRAWYKMWQGAKLIPLARNPYLARVICTLHKKDEMPANRAELYQAFVTELYEREETHAKQRGLSFPARDDLEDFLTDLARQMQAEQTTVLKLERVDGQDERLRAALDASILLLEGDNLRFAHQLLQEYFSARTLARQMYAGEDPQGLIGKSWWHVAAWRETALMLAEFTKEPERVAQWLGQVSPELATQTLQRLLDDEQLTTISATTRQTLIDSARDKLDETHPGGRAAAYRVLGLFGVDDRPGVGLDENGLLVIDWVEIPSGPFLYGSDKDKDPQAYDDETPQREVELDTFYMARYPITYRQFQAFVEAEDGFRDKRWWDGLAADEDDRQPADQWFKVWNHPRDQVSWYGAMAFCRWLSFKLTGDVPGIDKPLEWPVRLPTEQEWEKAARGTDGRIYPWGDEFVQAYANTSRDIGQTTAVGLYPQGASPYGVLDMSGNVWEWTLTEYESRQSDDITNGNSRVLRGGSWGSSQYIARAAYRIFYQPVARNLNFGFRLVVRRPPQLTGH